MLTQKEVDEKVRPFYGGNTGVAFNDITLNNINLAWRSLDKMVAECAVFRNVDFTGAFMSSSIFSESYFENCVFRGSHLDAATFSDCEFNNVNFSASNLKLSRFLGKCKFTGKISFEKAKLEMSNVGEVCVIPQKCPPTGSFIGWKKCQMEDGTPAIVKLLIPEDARRSSGTGHKCRCDKAKVIAIETIAGNTLIKRIVYSCYDPEFTYTLGETVSVPDFNEDRWVECGKGIHFFMTRQEAVDYNFR